MKRNKSGFTLVELLAVVLIIGILTSVALPQYRRSVLRAEAMEAMVNLKTIFDSARRYRAANSESPTKLNGLDVSFFDADTPNSASFNIGKFRYGFNTDYITACRLNGSGNTSGTYCFNMNYNLRLGTTYYKDLLTCASNSTKYSWVCESLKTDELPDGTIVVGDTL